MLIDATLERANIEFWSLEATLHVEGNMGCGVFKQGIQN